jgi:ABC-type branched-subunit amino acid transport system permease subunit
MVIAGLIAVMVVVVIGVAKMRLFTLLLALVPAGLPVFFVITYSAWLWFFGHNLHPWGAFTVKPFMPTVFGEGKVAQFSTYSYPYWGYGLLVLAMLALLLAILIRRKQMKDGSVE